MFAKKCFANVALRRETFLQILLIWGDYI